MVLVHCSLTIPCIRRRGIASQDIAFLLYDRDQASYAYLDFPFGCHNCFPGHALLPTSKYLMPPAALSAEGS